MGYEKEMEQIKEEVGDLLKASQKIRICNALLCIALLIHVLAEHILG